jgi:hypothetical protein
MRFQLFSSHSHTLNQTAQVTVVTLPVAFSGFERLRQH